MPLDALQTAPPNVGAFQAAFPAFRTTDAAFIQATLARAQRWNSPRVWGDRWQDGVFVLAAHWLFIDPMGQTTALEDGDKGNKSPYLAQYLEMRKSVTRLFGVAGGRGPLR